MKNLVWVFGALLALSFVLPHDFPAWPVPTPPTPDVVPDVGVDDKIVTLLAAAPATERARVVGVYTALAKVLARDAGERISTTGKFAELQASTLTLAIEQPGKYPGLDVAIDNVFLAAIGTRDEIAITETMRTQLIAASEKIANSAR